MEPKKSTRTETIFEHKHATTEPGNLTIEPIDWQAAFLDDHHNCPLCGSELLLTNVTHFVNQEVREEASCESCHIRVRQATHRLH